MRSRVPKMCADGPDGPRQNLGIPAKCHGVLSGRSAFFATPLRTYCRKFRTSPQNSALASWLLCDETGGRSRRAAGPDPCGSAAVFDPVRRAHDVRRGDPVGLLNRMRTGRNGQAGGPGMADCARFGRQSDEPGDFPALADYHGAGNGRAAVCRTPFADVRTKDAEPCRRCLEPMECADWPTVI